MKSNNTSEILETSNIESKIYTIRGVQVMLDRDLAELYQVETKNLNKAVNRNNARFPISFRFQLTKEELENLRFQIGTFRESLNTKYLPYVFTEQGVSMLSAVLRSEVAIEISIKIIETFVAMRKIVALNGDMFSRFERIEHRLTLHDSKFEILFNALEDNTIKPSKGIFYDGQIFDAHNFISDLIRSAKISIMLIDNYIDDTILTLFAKNQNIKVTLFTHTITKQLQNDLNKYNSQYNQIVLKTLKNSHDRFLIIDDVEIYHIGASLKDLGKKWFTKESLLKQPLFATFGFSKFESDGFGLVERLKENK
jgi:hypothetical protein